MVYALLSTLTTLAGLGFVLMGAGFILLAVATARPVPARRLA